MTTTDLAVCKTAFPEAPIEATEERSLKEKERRGGDSPPSIDRRRRVIVAAVLAIPP